MSDDCYTSQGTVRVNFRFACPQNTTLHFFPAHRYSVEHCGNIYAVFISQNCTSQDCTNAITKKCGQDGVKIEGDVSHFVGLVSAAACQVAVEVIVKNGGALKLVGIKIPAK